MIDAPIATTSSGLIVHKGSRLNISRTAFCTAEERVEPPTKTTCSISSNSSFASRNTRLHTLIVLSSAT